MDLLFEFSLCAENLTYHDEFPADFVTVYVEL